MTQPVWLLKGVALAVHDLQLAEHGGPTGVRDDALLESVLARPINLHAYGDSDLCALAAAYAFRAWRGKIFVAVEPGEGTARSKGLAKAEAA